ncbi:hypothetical protein SUDANB1_07224 [Streptomyces sp. enrichment culture]
MIRRLLPARTAAVFVGAFVAAAIATFADGVSGVAGDILCLAYGTTAACVTGWASHRSGDAPSPPRA